jgi:hypothetical protein
MAKPLFALVLVLLASARDRKETCASYSSMTGTTTTDCRRPGVGRIAGEAMAAQGSQLAG